MEQQGANDFEQNFMQGVRASTVAEAPPAPPKAPTRGKIAIAAAALAVVVVGVVATVVVVMMAHPSPTVAGGGANTPSLDITGSWVCMEGEGNHYNEAMVSGVDYWFSPFDPNSKGMRYEFDKDGNFEFRVLDGDAGAVEGIYQLQEPAAGFWQLAFNKEYPGDWYLSTLVVQPGQDGVLEFSLVGGGYILRCEKE